MGFHTFKSALAERMMPSTDQKCRLHEIGIRHNAGFNFHPCSGQHLWLVDSTDSPHPEEDPVPAGAPIRCLPRLHQHVGCHAHCHTRAVEVTLVLAEIHSGFAILLLHTYEVCETVISNDDLPIHVIHVISPMKYEL